MKKKWLATIGLSLILTGAVCLLGCSSLAPSSGSKGTSNAAATVAYVQTSPYGDFNEYSTVAADNGSLVGKLTLPTPYFAQQFATDLSGRIYVAACGPTNEAAEVFVYPPNSTGTTAPSSTLEIGSCASGVSDMVALAVDPAGQFLYVETPAPVDSPKTISVYPVAASGAPVAIRTLQLTTGWGDIAVDANENIFVTGSTSGPNGVINVYSPAATGSDAPTRTITLENEQVGGVAVDANGEIFATVAICCDGTDWVIEEFAAGAEGLASPTNTINLPLLPAGTNSGLVRLDAAANIFASVVLLPPPTTAVSTTVIYGFRSTATSHAVPTVTINIGGGGARFALN
jgi:hypothetical protein